MLEEIVVVVVVYYCQAAHLTLKRIHIYIHYKQTSTKNKLPKSKTYTHRQKHSLRTPSTKNTEILKNNRIDQGSE